MVIQKFEPPKEKSKTVIEIIKIIERKLETGTEIIERKNTVIRDYKKESSA